uniref:Uncharacterized protein n=1 Tax=Manihot esculenta TaxID=3983 RepID=A0A2C9W618_MANES
MHHREIQKEIFSSNSTRQVSKVLLRVGGRGKDIIIHHMFNNGHLVFFFSSHKKFYAG